MKVTSVLVVVAALLHSASPHSFGVGRCKTVNYVEDFNPNQFQGLWYVIEIFSTTSNCMTMTFNQTGTGLTVTEAREFYLANKFDLDHTFTNEGYLTVPNPSIPAKMRVRWPSNFLGSADLTIVDTDYTNFAVLYECKSMFVIHRSSAVILSRQKTLDSSKIQQIKEDLAKSDIDISDFDIIDHRTCNVVGEADFNWSIDEDTFGSLGEGIDSSIPDITIPDILLPIQEDGGDAEIIYADPTQNEVL